MLSIGRRESQPKVARANALSKKKGFQLNGKAKSLKQNVFKVKMPQKGFKASHEPMDQSER
eukprot:3738606-Amphidinium_carterae.1